MSDITLTNYGGFTRIRVKTSFARNWLRNHPEALQWHGAVLQWHGAIDMEPHRAYRIARMMCGDGLLVTFTPKGTTDEAEDHPHHSLPSNQRHLDTPR